MLHRPRRRSHERYVSSVGGCVRASSTARQLERPGRRRPGGRVARCTWLVIVAGCPVGRWAPGRGRRCGDPRYARFRSVAGTPARRIGWGGRAGARLDVPGDGVWRCPQTGDLYAEERGVLSEMRKGDPADAWTAPAGPAGLVRRDRVPMPGVLAATEDGTDDGIACGERKPRSPEPPFLPARCGIRWVAEMYQS